MSSPFCQAIFTDSRAITDGRAVRLAGSTSTAALPDNGLVAGCPIAGFMMTAVLKKPLDMAQAAAR